MTEPNGETPEEVLDKKTSELDEESGKWNEPNLEELLNEKTNTLAKASNKSKQAINTPGLEDELQRLKKVVTSIELLEEGNALLQGIGELAKKAEHWGDGLIIKPYILGKIGANIYNARLKYFEAIEINPGYSLAYCNAGIAYYLTKVNNQEAISNFKRAIAFDHKNANAYFNMGYLLFEMGYIEGAIVCYKRVIEIEPKNVDAYSNLGVVLCTAKSFAAAIECYDKAINIEPGRANLYYNKAIVLGMCGGGDDQKAVECYKKAIEIDPGHPGANKFETKPVIYKRPIEGEPQRDVAYYNLAVALDKHGKTRAAIQYYKKAIAVNPQNESAQNSLNEILCKMGGFKRLLNRIF
jgi:tetratricopeptide (TPR) repeat protein